MWRRGHPQRVRKRTVVKKKEIVDHGHRMGKFCGYEQLANGNMRVDPTYSHQLREISEKELSLEATANAFAKAMQQLYEPITAAKRKLFARIAEDYDIDLNRVAASLNYETGVLVLTPIPPPVGKSEKPTT